MVAPILTTERLRLRPYEKGDIVAWQRWDTDSEIQKYLPGPANEPVSDEEQERYLNECLAEKDGVYWTIVYTEAREIIGTVSIGDIVDGVGEISIVIGERQYWGKGIATEAIGRVISYAKEDLGLRKLTAGFHEENEAIAKLLKSLGFECAAHPDMKGRITCFVRL